MKNLLIITAILVTASVATAGLDNLDFTVDGVVSLSGSTVAVTPGTHTIGIYNSEAFTGASALTWVEVGTWYGPWDGQGSTAVPGSGTVNDALLPGTWAIDDYGPYGGAYLWYIVNEVPAVGDSQVGEWFTFGIDTTGIAEPITITLYKDDFATVLGTLTVPEPATMALMGLGGLALARRKKLTQK